MYLRKILTISLLLCVSCLAFADDVWLFTSFREPSTDGLRYLYSEDGLHWDCIPGVWMKPMVGNENTYIDAFTGEEKMPSFAPEHRVMRDPSIIKGPDGIFHLVWTTQWMGSHGFGYASSPDLIHWSEQRVINVMDSTKTNNVWAPELFYDEEKQQYLIIWSSQISPDDYTDEDKKGSNACHRMYYCTTKDFISFSETRPYYDPGFNSIDGYLLKRGEKDYVLIVKDNRKPGYSNLFCVFSNSPYGPFHSPSPVFGRTYSEGPCAIRHDDYWIVFYDQYRPQEYGAVMTRDFHTFTPMQDSISFPSWHKHGTVIRVSRDILNNLLR